MKNTIVEEFQKKCKNCGHPKADHDNLVLDPKDNPKAKFGSCRRDSCNCKKFESNEFRYSKEYAELLGKTLGDAILQNWCSPSEIASFKKQYDLQEIEKTEEEYLYLLMFIVTYSCQIVFTKNNDIIEIILDNLYERIIENKFNLSRQIIEARDFENNLRDRYAQYYDLLRNKEGNIDLTFFIRQMPYNFFANVLKKDLNYVFFDKKFTERWGRSKLILSAWIGGMIKEIIDFLIKLKEKHKIKS